MTSTLGYGWIRLPVLAAGFALAGMGSAAAQATLLQSRPAQPAPTSVWPTTPAAEPANAEDEAVDANAPDAKDSDAKDSGTKEADAKDDDMKTVDVNNLDWSQINIDASRLTINPASKARRSPLASPDADVKWSSNDKPNGAAVTAKQSLSEFLDTQIGADMNVVRQPATITEQQLLSERLANGGSLPQSSGTAWATITAPGVGQIWDKTAVEARVDPSQDQSKLGTSLSKSIPIDGQQYSVTLQNGYNLIQQGIVPVPGIPGRPARSYETDQSAKLSIAETGTSFTAGQTLSTSDDRWLRRVGAEQKLFGGVSINGSIGETAYGPTNKSLTAGYKQSW
jgi:hypothetical protein